MTHEEIRAMLDWNLARVREIHERAVARKAAEQAALISKPQEKLKPARRLSRPRIGPAMRRCAEYAAMYPGESVTAVLTGCGIDTTHSSNRQPIYRAEAAGLLYIDRVRSNLYRVYPTRTSAETDRRVREAMREAERCGEPLLALEIMRRTDEARWAAT